MNFGNINIQPCVDVVPPPDARCSDQAFAIANPDICGVQSQLILKPGTALVCTLGSIQFKAFSVLNGVETDVSSDSSFTSGDLNVALIGAASGNCTGISAGETTITATYQGKTATAQIVVLSGDTCCDQQHVAMLVIVDSTKSMSQQFGGGYATRLDFAKAAAVRFVSEVNTAKDTVALMNFHGTTVTSIEDFTDVIAPVLTGVAGIYGSNDKTEFYDAMVAGIASLNATSADRKVLLLISDGEDTLTSSFDSSNDPLTPLGQFKNQGGIVICLGCRASGEGFAMLSQMATGGFFINGYPDNASNALDYLSGLKGYICAGNCTPAGDIMVAKGKLNFSTFANWDVQDGTVDLCGNGFYDFLPGNGLYVDMRGDAIPQSGKLVLKNAITLVSGHSYRLSFYLAGNQRQDIGPMNTLATVFSTAGGGDVLSQTVSITDYSQDFTKYSFTFVAPSDMDVKISFQQPTQPTGCAALCAGFGNILDDVKFEDVTNGNTVFSDNFDSENLTYVPPSCGTGTTYVWLPDLNAYGYAVGYDCYGTGCLNTPPGAQSPDPNPLPDIESGSAPPGQTYTSTKTQCVSCPSGSENVGSLISPTATGDSPDITASSEAMNDASLQAAWLAFDEVDSTYWASQGGVPQWLQVKLAAAVTATTYGVKPLPFVGKPTAWTLSGSNDGTTWTVIDTRVDPLGIMLLPSTENVFPISTPGSYQYYRLNVTAVNSHISFPGDPTGGVDRVGIVELTLYGTAETQQCATETRTASSQSAADSAANAAALASANALLNCRAIYTSTQQYTAHCAVGDCYGPDVMRSASATSFISQDDADAQALAAATAAALAALDCTQGNNTGNIIINDKSGPFPAPASPYPSIKCVTGLTGVITKVVCTLRGITHSSPSDILAVLRSPSGTYVTLMRNCGGADPLQHPISNVTLIFDDTGASLPAAGLIVADTYAPTQIGPDITLPPPATAPPYATSLAQFNGEDPNGGWALFIADCVTLDAGNIANGFDLTITTA